MIDEIEQVAIRSKAPLLLTGPTGRRQIAARAAHLRAEEAAPAGRGRVRRGELRDACAATARCRRCSATRKGAFTGAVGDRPGLLRAADGGVLFLDEIGELGLDEQAMILRAIEEKRFLPVGADREATSDFQLIAGTNRDLGDAVARGPFPRGSLRPPQPVDLRAARP